MKKILLYLSLGVSLISTNLSATDDFELSDKEKAKIIEDRDKAKKMKETSMDALRNEKYFMDFKYNIMMNCLNVATSTNDLKDCNDNLKNEMKKEQDKIKTKQKEKEEYENKLKEQQEQQEKMKLDSEKEELKRQKEAEKEQAKKQKEAEREQAKRQKEAENSHSRSQGNNDNNN